MAKEREYGDGPVTPPAHKAVEETIGSEREARLEKEKARRRREEASLEFMRDTNDHLKRNDRDILWLKLRKDVGDMNDSAHQGGYFKELGLTIRFFKHAVEFAIQEGLVPAKLKTYFGGFKRATYALAASAVISVGAIGYVVYKNHGLLNLETTTRENSSSIGKIRKDLDGLTRDSKSSIEDLTDALTKETERIGQDSQRYTDGVITQLTSNQTERIKQEQAAYEFIIAGLNGRITTNEFVYEHRFAQAERELTKLSPTGSIVRIVQETSESLEQTSEQLTEALRDINALNQAGYGSRIRILEGRAEEYAGVQDKNYSNVNTRIKLLEQKELGYEQTLKRIEDRIQRTEEENRKLRIENKTLKASQVQTNSPAKQ
jgi:hypothetical protein